MMLNDAPFAQPQYLDIAKNNWSPTWREWFIRLVTAINAGIASFLDFATELSAKNAGGVTLLAASTQIVTLDLGTVTAGQRWFVSGHYDSSKGVTAGSNEISLSKSSGTAGIAFEHDMTSVSNDSYNDASSAPSRCIEKIMKVTADGTLVIQLSGASGGSNSTVAAGGGQVYAVRMK